MGKSKRALMLKPAGVLDWTGLRTQQLEYGSAAMIFAQGDPATSVMYVEQGVVRLSVLSHAGKEAVVAVLDAGHFFGEGLPCGPVAADGHCDGNGPVHDPGRREAGNGAAAPRPAGVRVLAEMVGTTRSRVNFFMNKFRKLGFIDYNADGLKIDNSLLTVVLRD